MTVASERPTMDMCIVVLKSRAKTLVTRIALRWAAAAAVAIGVRVDGRIRLNTERRPYSTASTTTGYIFQTAIAYCWNVLLTRAGLDGESKDGRVISVAGITHPSIRAGSRSQICSGDETREAPSMAWCGLWIVGDPVMYARAQRNPVVPMENIWNTMSQIVGLSKTSECVGVGSNFQERSVPH